MTALHWAGALVLFGAAGLGAVVAWLTPHYWPIAGALAGVLSIDVLRRAVCSSSPRWSLALYLAGPVLSAGAAVWSRPRLDAASVVLLCVWPQLATWCLLAPNAGAWWTGLALAVHIGALMVQAVVLALWIASGETSSVVERSLLVLLAGDLGAFLVPEALDGPWALAQVGRVTTMCAVVAVQIHHLWWSPCASQRGTT